LVAQSNGEPPAAFRPYKARALRRIDPANEERRMNRRRPKQALKNAKLDLTSPWLRCLLGSIIALQRPTPPSRRHSL